MRRARSRKDRVRRFFRMAKSWSRMRTVIARVERRKGPTYASSSNLSGRSKLLYEKVYCARGRMENILFL